jgi:hypothetical protein
MSDVKRLGRWIGVPLAIACTATLACIGVCLGVPCFPTGLRYGLWLDECPAGRMRLGADVSAQGLVRGAESTISVRPYARYVRGEGIWAWVDESTMFRGASVEIEIRDLEDKPVEGALTILDSEKSYGAFDFEVKVGDLPDGDYKLHAKGTAPFETVELDVPLALYAPAISHVMTDRPLYKPGQEVLLRSVTFRRTDLTPLDGRPGRWRITSPRGDEMLVERDKAGSYGVADTSFPLDSRAAVGTWTATWESGATIDTTTFEVRPFRLPRLTIEATPTETWYPKGKELVFEGRAKYASGAPVANAPVTMTLGVAEGRWPMPLEWEETFTAKTDGSGRFRVPVGLVPPDLIERAVLGATFTVTEAAGESVTGSARAVLSEHDLKVEAVTELGDGLVGGFNNRAYLRVTTPDGRPLRDADVKVAPWWDPTAKPYESKSDSDGVAALQIDPGDPVTVVIEAPPFRPRPLVPQQPYISGGQELLTGNLSLSDRRAIERVFPDVAACGDLTVGDRDVSLGVRVDAGGAVRRVMTGASPLESCVSKAVQKIRFESDEERTFQLTLRVPDSLRPSLYSSFQDAWGDSSGAQTAMNDAALRVRRCMSRGQGISGSEVVTLHWAVDAGSKAVQTTLAPSEGGSGLSASAESCVRDGFRGLSVAKASEFGGMGTATFTLTVPSQSQSVPQDQTITAYQLRVTALSDGAKLGEAPLVLNPSYVPPLRIRPTPTLAKAGDEVTFDLLRGPDFYGEIPKKLHLYEGTKKLAEADVDEKARSAKFVIPEGTEGFVHVDHAGYRGVVWVEPAARLAVSMTSDKPAYEPGETATLVVTTTSGAQPTRAGVGLSGVDSTLGQLAPLLQPDAYGRVTVRATSDNPAFGAFDPKALTLGQITGENAAKAAVLRLTNLPMDPAGDEALYANGRTTHDDTEVLTRNFYRALDRLHRDVGAWEASAAAGELVTNEKMVGFWKGALAALRKEGDPAVDAFDRELTLDVLPADLLAQVDPRAVVDDATRLPEDVVAWDRFVDQEVR